MWVQFPLPAPFKIIEKGGFLMNKVKIKKVIRDREANSKLVTSYNSIKDASLSVDTKMDNWKVQMLIANAMNTGKRAFGCNWVKVN